MKVRAVLLLTLFVTIFSLSVAASVSAHQAKGLAFGHHKPKIGQNK